MVINFNLISFRLPFYPPLIWKLIILLLLDSYILFFHVWWTHDKEKTKAHEYFTRCTSISFVPSTERQNAIIYKVRIKSLPYSCRCVELSFLMLNPNRLNGLFNGLFNANCQTAITCLVNNNYRFFNRYLNVLYSWKIVSLRWNWICQLFTFDCLRQLLDPCLLCMLWALREECNVMHEDFINTRVSSLMLTLFTWKTYEHGNMENLGFTSRYAPPLLKSRVMGLYCNVFACYFLESALKAMRSGSYGRWWQYREQTREQRWRSCKKRCEKNLSRSSDWDRCKSWGMFFRKGDFPWLERTRGLEAEA